MNRNNIWIHVGIAVVLITLAAILGQIARWKVALNGPVVVQHETKSKNYCDTKKRALKAGTPEVLVRFKSGVSMDEISRLTVANNDAMSDEIEAVRGLTVIDDLDNADAEAVARQYTAMSEQVEYAEVNFQIKLDDPAQNVRSRELVYRQAANTAEMPND